MATEDYRSASYEIWQAMAAGWDRERSWMWAVSYTHLTLPTTPYV